MVYASQGILVAGLLLLADDDVCLPVCLSVTVSLLPPSTLYLLSPQGAAVS